MSNRKHDRPLSRPPAGPKKLMERKSPPKHKPGCGILLLTDLEPTHLLNKAFNKSPDFTKVPQATVSPLRPKHCRRACRQSQHRPSRSCWFIKGELIPAPRHDSDLWEARYAIPLRPRIKKLPKPSSMPTEPLLEHPTKGAVCSCLHGGHTVEVG